MHRIVLAVVALCLLAGMVSYAQGLEYPVVPPSDERYSSSERAVLMDAIDRLSENLRQSRYACMKYYPAEWSSRQFAGYTQGILANMGQPSILVAAENNGQEHVWLLVSVSLGLTGNTAWVPVEATPEPGARQIYLGRVPMTASASGQITYEATYVQFDSLVELPPNVPPVPVIRAVPSRGFLGEDTRFLGTQSTDADGEIILWFWSFGDDATSTERSPEHLYAEKGTYNVSLTVIDSRGATRTVTEPYVVGNPHQEPSGYQCPVCGG